MLKKPNLIILHAKRSTEFVLNALRIFKFGTKTDYYHHEINNKKFTKLVTKKFMKKVGRKSVLVVDNNSYHNVPQYKQVQRLYEKKPTCKSG